MSGSLISVSYQRDSGEFYALKRDESNSRARVFLPDNTTFLPLFLPAASPFVGTLPPKGFRERFVNTYLASNLKIRRRFPIGNPAALSYVTRQGAYIWGPNLPGGEDVQWVITNSVGEKNPTNVSFTASDTGQDDGTPGPGVAGT